MKFVVVGGGHGAATSLSALRLLSDDLTAVISIADDGGSSGVLRKTMNIGAVGDLRKCLIALADEENALLPYFEHRFNSDALEGHALGNLLLAGLCEAQGDLTEAVRVIGQVLGVRGVVVPASEDPVELVAKTSEGELEGQATISTARGIQRVWTKPSIVNANPAAVEAIASADAIFLGPGSLFTSVLAATAVPGITEALEQAKGLRCFVANLPGDPESDGLDFQQQLEVLAAHHVPIDVVLCDENVANSGETLDMRILRASLADGTGRHDRDKLAQLVATLVAR